MFRTIVISCISAFVSGFVVAYLRDKEHKQVIDKLNAATDTEIEETVTDTEVEEEV